MLTIIFCLHFIVCLNFLVIRVIFAPSGIFIEPPPESVVDASFWHKTNDGKWVDVIKDNQVIIMQQVVNNHVIVLETFHSQFYLLSLTLNS